MTGAIERVDSKDPSLVGISLGTDHGLKVGHTLEVYRLSPTAEYVGRIRVEDAAVHSSVGRLIQSTGNPPRMIRVGDHVGSSLANDANLDALTLLRQARALFLAGRFDEAAKLAQTADSLNRRYGLFEDSPKKLLDDIARGRGQVDPEKDANLPKAANPADNVVIRLKNASAAEIAKVLDEAFNGRVPNDRIRVVADPATNSLIVKAAPVDLATLRNVINRLDIDNNAPAQRLGGDARVLPLSNVQAKEIAKVLIELFKKEVGQGLTIVAEPMTNSLLVRGTVGEQDAVAAVVRRLDEAASGKANPSRSDDITPPSKTPGKKADSKRSMIERKLAQPISLNFQDVPLYRVVQDLSVISGLNIVVDQPALKAEKISLEQPLRLKVEDITLDSALKLLLRQAKLTYVIRDEVLCIVPDSANPSTNASSDPRRGPKPVLEPR